MTAAAMSPAKAARHGGDLKLHRDCGFGEVSKQTANLEGASKQCARPEGFTQPLIYITLVAPADLAQSVRPRGGARNSASRESRALSPTQVGNLLAAVRHADTIGLPLNRMITIHWGAAGVPLAGLARATGRFVDLMSKALARHGAKAAWVWTHENGQFKGPHCHLLFHVPPALVATVTHLQKRWLRTITDRPYKAHVIASRPIGRALGVEASNHDLHAANLRTATAYLVKGADAKAAARFHMVRLEPGGRIIGKRCGVSQNIGPSARKAFP